ncbi:hypothetical protein [Alteromonas facilis]|uniref:hypothetical protein n=1 Tax=Alteromonas facilis TaxID=2048004 RepID=UPI000C281808|nr:hypothetical protein [Alteromonas facilis]
MNQRSLNHQETPEALRAINATLEALLCEDDVDSEALLAHISERDSFIQDFLTSLTEEQRRSFSQLEIEINNYLIARVAEIGKSTLLEATSQIRKRKAANKYLE